MDAHKIVLSEDDLKGLICGHILTLGEHGEIQICLKDVGFDRVSELIDEAIYDALTDEEKNF